MYQSHDFSKTYPRVNSLPRSLRKTTPFLLMKLLINNRTCCATRLSYLSAGILPIRFLNSSNIRFISAFPLEGVFPTYIDNLLSIYLLSLVVCVPSGVLLVSFWCTFCCTFFSSSPCQKSYFTIEIMVVRLFFCCSIFPSFSSSFKNFLVL